MAARTTSDRTETSRVEAFSDGVFAIAITLLVLDLKVPRGLRAGASLTAALLAQWPSYFAFLTSFLTIGIMWLNHHRLYTLIRRSDHVLLLLNALLLLGVTIVPFPTALVAAYLGAPQESTAVAVYSGTFVVIAICFNGLWHYAAWRLRLLGPEVDGDAVRAQGRQYAGGPILYLVAFALAWTSPVTSLAVNFALALFFALPPRILLTRSGTATGELG